MSNQNRRLALTAPAEQVPQFTQGLARAHAANLTERGYEVVCTPVDNGYFSYEPIGRRLA